MSQLTYTSSSDFNNPPVSSPLRRQRVAQPPTLLTTSLNNSAQVLGQVSRLNNAQTPVSTSSLSSPFSLHNAASSLNSPLAADSPMAFRAPSGLSQAPYNPQQWARGGSDSSPTVGHAVRLSPLHARQSSRTVTYAPRAMGPDEPMASPPPPYSADANSPSPAGTTSPGTDFSHGTRPSSASTVSPAGPTVPLGFDRRSPNLAYTQSRSPIISSAAFPPPPSASRVRSSSRTHADRILSAMNIRSRTSNTAPPVNAIDTLQQTTAQLLDRTEQSHADGSRPPTARRAVSTGAIGTTYVVRSPLGESLGLADLGIILPPPPPGPPPASARSQSLCRPSGMASNAFIPTAAAPRARRPPGRGAGLETVPPTPAEWRDEEGVAMQSEQLHTEDRHAWQQPLHIETDNITQEQLMESPASAGLPTSGPESRRNSNGLVRSPAVRNRSALGLRERRSESRSGRTQGSGDSASPATVSDALSRPLGELVLNESSLVERRSSTRISPRSGRSFRGLDEALRSEESPFSSDVQFGSARSTPRAEKSKGDQSSSRKPPTPLISPLCEDFDVQPSAKGSPSSTRHGAGGVSANALLNPQARPLSHILHAPNDENINLKVMPLSPESTHSLMDVDGPESPKSFADRATERHRLFLQKEISASSDSERLHLFTQYTVAESRIRRERYAAVFDDERLENADLVVGMFTAPVLKAPELQMRRSHALESAEGSRRSSATSFADSQSHSQHDSSAATSEPIQLTLDTSVNDVRIKNFVPCLSPIASMSAVTGKDEMDSRGRAPSRWWESTSNPSNFGDGFKVLERSKRETKYMSAVLESDVVSPASYELRKDDDRSNQLPAYGDSEYPQEKVGWHEEAPSSLPPPPPRLPALTSAPFTPDPRKLDISRLITLPPAYPRHHPAVNNGHPDLAEVRNVVRSLAEFPEVDVAKDEFEVLIREKRSRANSWSQHQRSLHDQDMQFRMDRGEISQQEYDDAEASLESRLSQSEKELVQYTFDLFQSLVANPVHALYKARISRATTAFSALSSRLHSDSATHSPNLPQEAGDEKPELLEKLTMLKWLFEARETLYREQHTLLSQRNDYYKALVLLPYQQPITRNADKLADAERFFTADARRRQAAADAATVTRCSEFLTIIDTHVTRGVEIQLSAFWDIAPPLQALLQKVPSDTNRLRCFQILIPRDEVDENPAYWAHPLRYLYSVLNHAGASSRQFVDGQVSLWCLLQEVREGRVVAKWRAKESARLAALDVAEGQEREARQEAVAIERCKDEAMKIEEVRRGVEVLKERVGAVEEQWVEGLGGEIGRVKEGVRAWLKASGGWDEELEDGE